MTDNEPNADDFALAAVPRHAAVTLMPNLATELLVTFSAIGEGYHLSEGILEFVKALREFNTADLGETINHNLDTILEAHA